MPLQRMGEHSPFENYNLALQRYKLFSYALKVVLKHRKEIGIVFVACKEYLLALGSVFANMLNDRSAENTRARTGIKYGISRLIGIKANSFCHKTRGILFCKESSKSYVFRLGFFSYKLARVSYGEI